MKMTNKICPSGTTIVIGGNLLNLADSSVAKALEDAVVKITRQYSMTTRKSKKTCPFDIVIGDGPNKIGTVIDDVDSKKEKP
jgi:hypothetical protein